MVNVNMREAQDKVTYLLLSIDEDFASKLISRENLFLIEANTKYCQVATVTSSTSPEKQLLVTIFSLLNALGVYIFFLILRWASIGEGR